MVFFKISVIFPHCNVTLMMKRVSDLIREHLYVLLLHVHD